MPKTKSSKTETEQVATPAAAPVVEKKVRAPKASKVEAVSAPTTTEAPTTIDAAATTDADAITEQSANFMSKLQQLSVMLSTIKTEYRALEKKWTRDLKTAQKLSSKRKRKAGNRAPSGFVKPTKISDELASFLGKEKGTEMARTEVTRDINKYIRTHNLQDKDNGRKINSDTKLAALLKLKKTDELTYFNLQRYMSPHFAKATKEATTA
jgi:chromatin remodeling complex protein RSC6